MKTLYESLFDVEDNIENIDNKIKEDIKNFLKTNYNCRYQISSKPNKDGKYEVSSKEYVEVKNRKITSLTNVSFIWAEVGGDFYCGECNSLTSLKGAPKKVGRRFNCINCDFLTSLKGTPKKVGGNFNCCNCKIEFKEEDVKKVSNVKGIITV